MAGKKTSAAPTPAAAPKKKQSPSKVPLALAKRMEASVAAKQARLAKEASEDIALIRRRQADIAEAFYEVGEALVRLRRPGVVEAVGRSSFKELCQAELQMSISTANRLITIVTRVRREDALRMGQHRALALAELAKATPEAESVTDLEKGVRTLASGKKLHLTKATTREIQAAARELRASNAKGTPKRGKTTSESERSAAAALQEALRKSGLDRARVTAVATKPGLAADVRIEGVPLSAVKALGKALQRSR